MILLMGVIGAGKSLQGRMLASDDGYTWVSTGEIFRNKLSGEEAKKMKRGNLYSDEEVIKIIDKTLDNVDTNNEIIFDGFPRTIAQADWLMEQVKKGRLVLTALFNLKASEDVVSKRLRERGRFDDTEDGIKIRMGEYKSKTLPMINYFKKTGIKIINIDSNQTPEKVHQDIKSQLK